MGLFCFSLLFAETSCMHWAHGIENTNTLDVAIYLVLLMYGFSTVNED